MPVQLCSVWVSLAFETQVVWQGLSWLWVWFEEPVSWVSSLGSSFASRPCAEPCQAQ
jgi:hypothetical protein